MRRILYWAAGVVAFLAAVIAVGLVFFDWTLLKKPIEDAASAASGDHVTIAGPVSIHLGLTSSIDLDDVTIERPGWKPDPKVGAIKHLHIAVRLPSLLEGKIEVPELTLGHPVLSLIRRADGSSNFARPDSSAEGGGYAPMIDKIEVDGGEIKYRDEKRDFFLDTSLGTIRTQGGKSSDRFDLKGRGTYRNAPFTFHLRGGDLDNLRNPDDPYIVTAFEATLGPTRITAKGRLGDPAKIDAIDLEMSVEGDSAADLYRYLGVPAPETPPYKLTGHLLRSGPVWKFDAFKGTVGNSDLSGSLRFDVPPGEKLKLSGNLVSNRLDFQDTGLIVGAPTRHKTGTVVSEKQKAVERNYHEDPHVFPDAALKIDEVRQSNVDVTFKGTRVEAQDLPLQDVDLHVRIQDGVLRLDPLRIGVAGGKVDGMINIDARTDAVVTDYDLRLRKFQLGAFVARTGHPEYADGTIYGRIQLKGTGDSIRKSLAASNGEVSMALDKGHVSKLFSHVLGLDVMRSIGPLISGDKDQTPVNCLVVDFGVKSGVMTSKTFLIDTGYTTVATSGTIDLDKEQMDLAFNGRPKKTSPLALGGPILITGTIKDPSIGLGPKTYLRAGAAAALGVVLAPLAAILAFIDPGGEDQPNIDCSLTAQLKG